ncbi:cytochrome P450 2A13-like [Convolutriloba macropyga]|uniref:cytochrome P450 2A13-like n=1 Tax=Convolutriloba macropyga TaxID=536237 RepID=UPI003F521843
MEFEKILQSVDFSKSFQEFLTWFDKISSKITAPIAVASVVSLLTASYIFWRYGFNHGDHKDLPLAYWIRGHSPLLAKRDCTGKILESLYDKTKDSGPAYLRSYLSRNLVLFKLRDLKEIFQTYGSKSVDRAHRSIASPSINLEYISTKGILEISGPIWKNNRRIFHTFLRTWGRENLLRLITEESKHLQAALAEQKGEIDPNDLLQMAVCNIISTFIFGSRFNYYDHEMNSVIAGITAINTRNIWLPYIAWLIIKHVPIIPSFTQKMKGIKENKAFIRRKIEERIYKGVKSPPETLIDAYALESTTTGDKFDFDNLEIVIWELFFAGTETTSTTMAWFITAMAADPSIQSKMAEEIEHQIGERDISLDDFKSLPYTLAVQHEVQRFGCIAQNTIMHQMNTDVTLSSGRKLREKEKVFANLYTIMRDPAYFKYPYDFKPENFLDDDGQFVNSEAFVPYGVGPRICLGQNLADMEIKVFMIEICRNFRISSTDKILLDERVQKITNAPVPKKYLFQKLN